MARPPTGTVQWSGDHWRARVTLEDGSRPWLDLPRSIGRDDRERAQAKARELADLFVGQRREGPAHLGRVHPRLNHALSVG